MTAESEALALHRECVVVDLHADTPSLMRAGYDLFARHRAPPRPVSYGGHVDVPRMREGGLCAQVFGMWTVPRRASGAAVHEEIDAVERAAAARPDEIAIAWTADDVLAAHRAGRRAALLSIEGAHAVSDLDSLSGFARRGVRSLGLVHFSRNAAGFPAYGVGRDADRGLTDFGRALVDEMNRLGVLADLAHINRAGFLEAAARTKDPPIVSHTGVSGVHSHWRNIDDEQIRAVADRGGCIGVLFAPRYLGRDGVGAVVDHVAHLIEVGGEDVPALGSDFDGFVRPPTGLEDVSALPNLTAEMLRRGLSARAIEKVLGRNVLRVLAAVPPRARGS